MQRCLELAALGRGPASPNPLVGSVIVHDGKIIGEGYHRKSGKAHAEVNAIHSVKDQSKLSESTLYVNLEPCAHHGKTPPCADLITRCNIPNVVIGCVDTYSEVAGKGIEKLKAAGCNITVGVLEEESRHLNRRFFTFHEKKRPYVILKWAQTKDGFIDRVRAADSPVKVNWITNFHSKRLVHKWRHEEPAILVGTNTARNDNPSLTVREVKGDNPLRLVIDRKLELDSNLNLFDGSTPTIRYSAESSANLPNLETKTIDFGSPVIPQILEDLHSRNIQSLIVEGGRQLIQSFIDAELWDEARVFTGDVEFEAGLIAPKLTTKPQETLKIGADRVAIHYRQ